MKKIMEIGAIGLIIIFLIFSTGCTDQSSYGPSETAQKTNTYSTNDDFRTITDSRGKEVTVPKNIERVVTVSDGLIEGTMCSFGVEETIVAIGSSCMPKDYTYSYPVDDGSYVNGSGGLVIVKALYPGIADCPAVIQSGTAMNYESLASLEPDVVVIRLGCCAIQEKDDEKTIQTIETIENLGIPLVVLYSPNCYDDPTTSRISDEIKILGDLFENEDQAENIAEYLESQVEFVEERTKDVPEDEKPTILCLGLSPVVRSQGGAGSARGLDTTESYIIENVVNAKNAFQTEGGKLLVNTEQILAMDPDVIVLPHARGYHPAGELYNATYYEALRELSAIKNHRVYALPTTPCNNAMRLEHPLDVMIMAKAAYPELFEDVDLGEWILDYYKNVYNVSDEKAKELRTAQWLDWTTEEKI